MSEQCFDSYVKTFENSLGNESQLILKEANINLNDTIYGEFIFYNLVKIKELALNGMAIYVELIDATCGKYDKGTDYDNAISVITGALTIITGSLGIFGNLISIVVLCQKYDFFVQQDETI